MPHLFDYPLAVVDVETTGTNYINGGVIDIGVLRVEQGQVVQTFQQLINPGTTIPGFITQLTGISNQDLVNAPPFADICLDLEELLADCVFVAHNARFDYAFIKEEFRRCGIRFSPKTFCTVKLSRTLYPQARHHKLDALIERFNIPITNRHRAFDDAQATWAALDCMVKQANSELLEFNVKQQLRQPTLPPQLAKTTIDSLPESPGVYIFENTAGATLYVGKSINIRSRVLSHFADDVRSSKELKLSQEVANIRTIPTPGELGALLKEAQLVKTLMPIYNRMLRRRSELVVALQTQSADGFATINLQRYQQLDSDIIGQVMGVFRSEREAKQALVGLAKEYRLCSKLLGLEKTIGACFAHHLGRCDGACVGKETPLVYQLKFDRAFAKLRIDRWPYAGPILVKEQDAENDTSSGFILDQWCLVATLEQRGQSIQAIPAERSFDLDQYKIFRRFLNQAKSTLSVTLLKPMELRQLLATA